MPNIQDPVILTFERLVLKNLQRIEADRAKVKHNLMRQQRILLKELGEDSSIVIKPANKGGGIVILDRAVYKSEALRQLNDQTSYLRIDQDPTIGVQNLIRITVQEALSLD